MNDLSVFLLKSARHTWKKVFGFNVETPKCITDLDVASQLIYEGLESDQPFMVARFGATEMSCISNYFNIHKGANVFDYIRGKSDPWWWNQSVLTQMEKWSGFFPATENNAERFCEMMIECSRQVDLLGSWLPNEKLLAAELKMAVKVELELLNPFFAKSPWTKALAGRKVLVIHPFTTTIESQYKKRHLIFLDNTLPDFDLITVKAVQSLGGESDSYSDWFCALDHMRNEMDKVEYDICLIGCGAYGFPLAAHAKKMQKKAVHLGGSLQILFGIRGRRWEDPHQTRLFKLYKNLFNEHWVRPNNDETPKNAQSVENGCYW